MMTRCGVVNNNIRVEQFCLQSWNIYINRNITTPFKKVTQHDFNRLYQFVYGFVYIMCMEVHGKTRTFMYKT